MKFLILLISSISCFGQGFGYNDLPYFSGRTNNGGISPGGCFITNTALSNPTSIVILNTDTNILDTNLVSCISGSSVFNWINTPIQSCDTFNLTNTIYNPPHNSLNIYPSITDGPPIFVTTNGPNGHPYISFTNSSTTSALGTCSDNARQNIGLPITIYQVIRVYLNMNDPTFGQGFGVTDFGGGTGFALFQAGGSSSQHIKANFGVRGAAQDLGLWTNNWMLLVTSISSTNFVIRTNSIQAAIGTLTSAGSFEWGYIGVVGSNQKHNFDIVSTEIYPTFDSGTITITNNESRLMTKYGLP